MGCPWRKNWMNAVSREKEGVIEFFKPFYFITGLGHKLGQRKGK